MSLYVLIEKGYEDESRVVYNFGPSSSSFEQLEMNKKTGEIKKLETAINNPNYYYLKAVIKLLKYRENNPTNQYPDKLVYAS